MTAALEPRPLPFSARHYEDRLQGLPDQTGRGKGYHRGQTQRLVKDLISEVVTVQSHNARLRDEADRANEALKYHADDYAAARQPWEGGPPTLAIDAIVAGQAQAERSVVHGNAELRRRFERINELEAEAERLLAGARETSAAGPPELVLPPEPKATGNTVADAVAQKEWLRACREAIAAHRVALDEHQASIDEQRAAVAEHQADVDRHEAELVERRDGIVAALQREVQSTEAVASEIAAIDLTAEASDDERAEVA